MFIKQIGLKITNIIKWLISFLFSRFILLVGAGWAGWYLGKDMNSEYFCNLGFDEKVAEYLATASVGIPIFVVLWIFRTYDIRQQIDKAQEQIYQNRYNNAVENLTGGVRSKVEIGTRLLIKLSKENPKLNEEIKIAFKERLKFYCTEGEVNDIKIAYGKLILNWLFDIRKNDIKNFKRISLNGIALRDQDLSDIDFKNVDLTGADFKRSDLKKVVFENANLTGASFYDVNLPGETFKKNANLTRAYLKCANLRGANLTNANLTEVYFLDAIADEETKGVRGIWKVEKDKICIDSNSPCITDRDNSNASKEDFNNMGFYELIKHSVEKRLENRQEAELHKQKAEKQFDKAISRDGDFARAIYNRGYVYFLNGMREKSKDGYNKAQKLDPENPDFMDYEKFQKLFSRYNDSRE